ncbi:MAG: DUF433 domain-containing protein [Blastocatellia bacterium]
MYLNDFFDILAPNDVRLKGTRLGIETVLYEYIHRAQRPEAIARRFPSLTLEQVYATILYYLHNKEAVTAYLADWLEHGRQARAEQELNPPPFIAKLRQLKAGQQNAAKAVA